MNFELSDDQKLLAESIRRLIAKDYAFEARKKILASAAGTSDQVWAKFAEMGLTGLPFSPDYGGYGGAALDMMVVMEAIGEGLVVEPYLSTVGLGAQFVARAGSEAQKKAILPRVAAGGLKMAFAHSEKAARYDLAHVATQARQQAAGWTIDGDKCVALHAPCADLLVISARTAGTGRGEVSDPSGISLFLVDARAPGLTMKSYRTIDALCAADIALKEVHVAADALIGEAGAAHGLIEDIVDYGTALLCAEAVGAIRSANDATLEYLKTRKQFGVPIGTFQALQHRMVDMVISYEQAKSMACLACAKVDSEKDSAQRRRLISAAKIRIADACRHVSQEAIQLHGGMGMTEESKVSHTFRRLTMIAQQFGDADHHLERFAD